MGEGESAATAGITQDGHADAGGDAARADVCLLVEGTYPFVAGGVSSWVHDMILGHPELRFAVLNIGSHPEAYGEPRYQDARERGRAARVFCQEGRASRRSTAARAPS